MKFFRILLGFPIFLIGVGISYIPFGFLLGFLVGIIGLYILSHLLTYDFRGLFITVGGVVIYSVGMYHIFDNFLLNFLLALVGGLMAVGSCRTY